MCVATSEATQAQAEALGIRMTTLDDLPFLDLTVDGADELDGELRLIKGGGGALLREKIVATASGRMIVIADASKKVEHAGRVPAAGRGRALRPHGHPPHDRRACRRRRLRGRDPRAQLAGGKPFLTDGGNLILDCPFGRIDEPEELDEALKLIPGVVENGLFLGIADLAVIAGGGGITLLGADDGGGV